ncbi:MAG: hypothetical protein M3Y56_05130, partial [Armatimonadota bacterium]|nr:hypothetical protein [Armatimonadota bacterium]
MSLSTLLCAIALLAPAGQSAQGAPPSHEQAPYNINAPVYPVPYTDAQKDAQRVAGRTMIHKINEALAAGVHTFTVPPGIYRTPADGPDSAM